MIFLIYSVWKRMFAPPSEWRVPRLLRVVCVAGVWGGQPRPQGFTLRKWEEPEEPLPFSDGKALGTRLYRGRESCEYKGTPENKKGIPFFLPRTLRAAIAFSLTSTLFFSFPPPPTGYVRIRLKSGAIIGVGDCKCRVGAGSTRFHRKSQMSYF